MTLFGALVGQTGVSTLLQMLYGIGLDLLLLKKKRQSHEFIMNFKICVHLSTSSFSCRGYHNIIYHLPNNDTWSVIMTLCECQEAPLNSSQK